MYGWEKSGSVAIPVKLKNKAGAPATESMEESGAEREECESAKQARTLPRVSLVTGAGPHTRVAA